MASELNQAFPNPYKRRREVGFWLLVLGSLGGTCLRILGGAWLRITSFILASKNFDLFDFFFLVPLVLLIYIALPAPMAFIHLTVARLMDRYDAKPWYAIFGCLIWGMFAAGGFAAIFNGRFMDGSEIFSVLIW